MEGEPASQKDRALLCGAPHLVLDGAELAAEAVGAHVDRDVRGRRPRPECPIGRVAFGERAGPESVASPCGWSGLRVATSRARSRPSSPGSRAGSPTLNSDCPRRHRSPPRVDRSCSECRDTGSRAAMIAEYGTEWFRTAGLPDAPGTCLVTVSGPMANPGSVRGGVRHPDQRRSSRGPGSTLPSVPWWWEGTAGPWPAPAGLLDTVIYLGLLSPDCRERGGSQRASPPSPPRPCGIA